MDSGFRRNEGKSGGNDGPGVTGWFANHPYVFLESARGSGGPEDRSLYPSVSDAARKVGVRAWCPHSLLQRVVRVDAGASWTRAIRDSFVLHYVVHPGEAMPRSQQYIGMAGALRQCPGWRGDEYDHSLDYPRVVVQICRDEDLPNIAHVVKASPLEECIAVIALISQPPASSSVPNFLVHSVVPSALYPKFQRRYTGI